MTLVPEDDLPDTLRSTKPSLNAVPEDDLPDTAKALAATKTATVAAIEQEDEAARQKLRKAGYEASTMKPVTGEGGAAFGVFRQQDKAVRKQNLEQAKKDAPPKIQYEDFVNNDELIQVANKAMKAYGEPEFNPEKESRKDFVERFYSQQRWAIANTTFGGAPLALNMRNVTTEKARDLAAGVVLFDKIDKSPNQFRAIKDYAVATLLDPLTYAGAGVGKATAVLSAKKGVQQLATDVVKQKAAAEAAKVAATTPVEKLGAKIAAAAIEPQRKAAQQKIVKSAVEKGTIAGVATEGGTTLAANIIDQRAMREASLLTFDVNEQVPEEIQVSEEEKKYYDSLGEKGFNWKSAATATAIGTVLAGVPAAVLPGVRPSVKIRESGELIAKELKARGVTTTANMMGPPTRAEAEITRALTIDFDETVSGLVKQYGRKLLDEFDPATSITDSKINLETAKTATRVALNVLMREPEKFGWKGAPDQKISDAIYDVITKLDRADAVNLEQALAKSGVSLEDFAAMNLTTASDAGRELQQLSAAKRALNKLEEIAPGLNKRVSALYSTDIESVNTMSAGQKIWSTTKNLPTRITQETKAIVVSGLDTLARNVIGNSIGLGLKASVDVMEGFIFGLGKAALGVDPTKSRTAVFRESMADTWGKSVGTFVMLGKSGLASDVTENLLANNPYMLRRMSSVSEDLDTEGLSKFSRWANSFSTGMDGLFRRASFVSSVESQLKEIGIDLYKDVLANNKVVPSEILRRAYDDAAKDTFSYSPNKYKQSFSKFEDFFEGNVGAPFVSFFETPGLDLFVTFPRFVTNAAAFQYRYSPFGAIGATEYAMAARKAYKAGDIEKAELIARDAVRKTVQSATGVALLLSAYEYRLNNPDIGWSEVRTGSGTVDTKTIFPVAPVLGAGEILAQIKTGMGKIDIKGIAEVMAGFKAPAGTQNTILGAIIDFVTSEEARADSVTTLGKVMGDYVGRVTQPFFTKQIVDLLDLMRGDKALTARDPNVIQADTTEGKAVEAAVQRVQAKLPVVKEELPAALPRFKDTEIISKDAEFVNRIVGFRNIPERSEAEKEVQKYGVDIYSLYGRPSGDKVFDRLFIDKANEFTLKAVNDRIKQPYYKDAVYADKKAIIDDAIRKSVAQARTYAEGKYSVSNPEEMARIKYKQLSNNDKKRVNQRYAKDHEGRTMEEDKAYDKLPLYSDFSISNYARGGLVAQTQRLFAK